MIRPLTRNRSGFTLIELLTVVFIVSLLASIIVPNLRRASYRSKFTSCQSNLRNIATAMQIYYNEHQEYPDELGRIVPDYMAPRIPVCPSAGSDTYTAGYLVSRIPAHFTMRCHGRNHGESGYGENQPYYDMESGLGP